MKYNNMNKLEKDFKNFMDQQYPDFTTTNVMYDFMKEAFFAGAAEVWVTSARLFGAPLADNIFRSIGDEIERFAENRIKEDEDE